MRRPNRPRQGPSARRSGPSRPPASGLRPVPESAAGVSRPRRRGPGATAPPAVDPRSCAAAPPRRRGPAQPRRPSRGNGAPSPCSAASSPNSAALAARLGPEAMHALLSRFFDLAFGEVHRYEGTITRFLGDGFVALFGAPIAHEDAARRAVLAALGIQRRAGDLNAPAPAAGLASPNDLEAPARVRAARDRRAAAHWACTPARWWSAPSATTCARTTPRSARRPTWPPACSSLAEPGTSPSPRAPTAPSATTSTARRSASSRSRARPSRSPPTGCWARRRCARASRRRRARPHPVRGPRAGAARAPGLPRGGAGAARAGRLRRRRGRHRQVPPAAGVPPRARRRRAPAGWRGAASPTARTVPYLPIIDLLKRTFGVEEGDDEARILAARARSRPPSGTEGARADRALPQVPAQRRPRRSGRGRDGSRSRGAPGSSTRCARCCPRRAARRPLVLAVEDLHWIDEPSEAALAALVDAVPGSPVLLILTHRPGYAHPLGDRSTFTPPGAEGSCRPRRAPRWPGPSCRSRSLPRRPRRG